MDLSDFEEQLMIAEGFDDAILGVGHRCGQPALVVYDVATIITILMERDDMTYEEATEHFNFNIEGSWVGEKTPIWLHVLEQD